MQYDLKDLGAEEVGEAIVALVDDRVRLWTGERGGRGIVVSRCFAIVVLGGGAITLNDLQVVVVVDGSDVVAAVGNHVSCN